MEHQQFGRMGKTGRTGTTGRLDLPQRFDIMTSAEYRMPFVRLLGDANTPRLRVDLFNLKYIDSMGIGTLIAWDKSCRERGKAMVLERCDAKVLKTFQLAGVDRLFEFAPLAN